MDSKKGVEFVGMGKEDVSGQMPKSMSSGSVSESGGPVYGGPDTNKGGTAPTKLEQTEGMPPSGGPVKFAGDVGQG